MLLWDSGTRGFKTVQKQRIEQAVAEMLAAIGEDPSREGLVDTPRRVARMYEAIFSSWLSVSRLAL